MSEDIPKEWVVCSKCRKRLIERRGNILFFRFGKRKDTNAPPPVEMYFQGIANIRCLRRDCGHWNLVDSEVH